MQAADDHTQLFTVPFSSNDVAFVDRRPPRPPSVPTVPQESLVAWARAVARWAAPSPVHHQRLPAAPDDAGTPDQSGATDAGFDL
jgi:hypothetical protein